MTETAVTLRNAISAYQESPDFSAAMIESYLRGARHLSDALVHAIPEASSRLRSLTEVFVKGTEEAFPASTAANGGNPSTNAPGNANV